MSWLGGGQRPTARQREQLRGRPGDTDGNARGRVGELGRSGSQSRRPGPGRQWRPGRLLGGLREPCGAVALAWTGSPAGRLFQVGSSCSPAGCLSRGALGDQTLAVVDEQLDLPGRPVVAGGGHVGSSRGGDVPAVLPAQTRSWGQRRRTQPSSSAWPRMGAIPCSGPAGGQSCLRLGPCRCRCPDRRRGAFPRESWLSGRRRPPPAVARPARPR